MAKRMTTKAVQRLLDRTVGSEAATERRIELLEQGLPDEVRALLHGGARNANEFTMSQRLRQLIDAREERFGLFAFRAALSVVLGLDVSDHLLKRMFEDDYDEA